MRLCSIEGCGRIHDSKGFCHPHYNKWKRRGDPLAAALVGPPGSGWTSKKGYHVITVSGRSVFSHVAIAEKAFGKPLPPGAIVHHVDENPANNANSNLVICPSAAYHKLLHVRINALKASGHVDWRKCPYCKQYDDPATMRAELSGRFVHAVCSAKAQRESKAKRRAA